MVIGGGEMEGHKDGRKDRQMDRRMDGWKYRLTSGNPPGVLQEIGLLGPLPKKVELVMQGHNIVVDGHPTSSLGAFDSICLILYVC